MKKIYILLLVATSLFAGHQEGVRWGIGCRAGMTTGAAQVCSIIQTNRDAQAIPVTGMFNIQTILKVSNTSFQGGGFAEVGYRMCNWSCGILADVNGDSLNIAKAFIEGAINLSAIMSDNGKNQDHYCVKAPLHIGVDLRAGRYMHDILWYALIGGEAIRMRYSHYYSDPGIISGANNSLLPVVFGTPCVATYDACGAVCNSGNKCNSFWKGALRVGTGVEYNWRDCFNLKLEYRFVWTGKKQLNFASPVVAGFVGVDARNAQVLAADTVSFKQSVTALMFSYQF